MSHPIVAVVATSVVLSLAAGCSSSQPAPASDPVVVVAGTHANAAVPTLTPAEVKALGPAIEANRFGGIVIADSTPALTRVDLVEVGGTPAGRANRVTINQDRIRKAMATAPDSNGADTFEAIALAAGQIKATSATGTIIVAASGLDDTGVMAMTQPHLLDASPADLVAARRQALSRADLKGITVIMSGLGQTVAPQSPLDSQRRAQLADLWTAVLKAAGARVDIDTSVVTGTPVSTTKTVTPVPITTTQPA